MDADSLRALQAPLKARYRDDPASAKVRLHAESELAGDGVSCKVQTGKALVEAGLHPASGGDGLSVCAGDMLLESLVACAGVTLKAVATALAIPLRGGRIRAEGVLDFRGTLAVDREVPVGFSEISLTFTLDAAASRAQLQKLIELTERYCVVLQTLRRAPTLAVRLV